MSNIPFYDSSKGTLLDGAEAFRDLMSRVGDVDNASATGDGDVETFEFIGSLVDRYMRMALDGERPELRSSADFRRGFFLALGKLMVLNSDGSDIGRDWQPLKDKCFGSVFAAKQEAA